MITVWFYSLLSVFAVSLVSFVGLLTFRVKAEKLRVLLIYFISFAAGALFGDAFFHLIPQIVKEQSFGFEVSLLFIAGILIFFIIEKAIHLQHYHSHGEKKEKHIEPFAYTVLIGDVVHNLGDGLIIGASYLVSLPIGLATTLAVAFHEIPHEVGNFGSLVHGGFSRGKALGLNFVTALTAIIGTVAALLLSNYVSDIQKILLPIAAGGFIYIAGSDLIPELHKESESFGKVFWQLIVFIIGILLMAALLLLE